MKFKHTPPHLLLCALFHLPALPPGNKAALYGLPIASPAGNGPPWFTKMLMFSLRAEPRPAPEHDRAVCTCHVRPSYRLTPALFQ